MKIKDITPNADNPRTITDAKLSQLKKALAEFGDLSGIVYNRKSKSIVSGHQRHKLLDPKTDITITKKYSKPTKTGTVAEGYFMVGTDKFSYREVYWTAIKEKAAVIAANKNAGEWDMPKLNEWLKELSSFDLDFDVNLTMFDADELAALPNPIEVGAHTRVPGTGKDAEEDKEPGPPKCQAGQVYKLGTHRLKCGEEDLHYCDLIISRWEKYSGQEAILEVKTKNKAAGPSSGRHAENN